MIKNKSEAKGKNARSEKREARRVEENEKRAKLTANWQPQGLAWPAVAVAVAVAVAGGWRMSNEMPCQSIWLPHSSHTIHSPVLTPSTTSSGLASASPQQCATVNFSDILDVANEKG